MEPERHQTNYEQGSNDQPLKITIPQPFSFEQREK